MAIPTLMQGFFPGYYSGVPVLHTNSYFGAQKCLKNGFAPPTEPFEGGTAEDFSQQPDTSRDFCDEMVSPEEEGELKPVVHITANFGFQVKH